MISIMQSLGVACLGVLKGLVHTHGATPPRHTFWNLLLIGIQFPNLMYQCECVIVTNDHGVDGL